MLNPTTHPLASYPAPNYRAPRAREHRPGRVRRLGRAIAASAAAWDVAVTALGLAPDIGVALGCLVAAGAADMLSGIFRDTLWNQSIPDALRGRMAGVELLSYAVGPSAGQARGGAVAALTSARFALCSGGPASVAAVGAVYLALPAFARYGAAPAGPAGGRGPSGWPTSA